MKKNKKKKISKKAAIPAVLALSVAFGGLLPTSASFAAETANTSAVLFKAEGLSKKDVVKAYLQSQVKSPAVKLVTPGEQFKIIRETADSTTNTYHVLTVEQYKGIPIYGSGQTVALDANNDVYASLGKVTQNLARTIIPTEASISKDEAIAIVKEDVESQIGEVKSYDGIDSELTIYPHEGKYYLTYLVKASTSVPAPGYFHYFVDATSGKVINSFNALHNVDPTTLSPVTARGLDVFGKLQSFPVGKDLETGTSYMYGASVVNQNTVPIATYDARRTDESLFIIFAGLLGFSGWEVSTNSASNFFYDPAAVSAHVNSDKVNKYYQNIHKRNSLDDKGMTLINSVHVGIKWNNAGWNGKQMLYGDGDGIKYGSLSGALDVTGHEMTHGVITNTTDLTYENESGAINESLADIFGQFTQMYTTGVTEWDLGEDIYTPNIPGDGGLRSMSDPASKSVSTAYMPSGRYPDHYDDRYLGTLDNGGVHINSGINNKAAYLITQGGTNNGITIKGIGRTKAEKIYYRALTLYLTPTSGFHDMREAAIHAARDLHPDKNGAPSAETQAVMDAYTSVGVN
ncbi:peptidase M4 [Sporosarcina globispora]|uniref:Neutral metalloproteinase n=1 Tax=Sporosarcina globispora TaxID=1459 RepID=A0A0M0G904_SPOGL|nr:M4 family metallopeptidase [Sporosarcina globispora]KON85987.1 peptidase M4 [Sporosarcina globispora]